MKIVFKSLKTFAEFQRFMKIKFLKKRTKEQNKKGKLSRENGKFCKKKWKM